MRLKVLGISGSPVPNSNTDRAVKAVLEATGLENEFIKLSDYHIRPCLACRRCVKDNICKQDDDFGKISKKVLDADALVIGAYAPYSQIDAFTKAFLERLWSMRHLKNLLRGKLVVLILSRVYPPLMDKPIVRYTGISKLIRRKIPSEKIMDLLSVEFIGDNMEIVGKVKIRGNVPCLTCGRGNECQMSGVPYIYGKKAKASSDLCLSVEEQEDVWKELQNLGKKIAILSSPKRDE